MSANLRVQFRKNAQDLNFWGGAGADTSPARLAQWMGAGIPENRDNAPDRTEPDISEDARLEMRIKRGDAVAELGAGIVSQQAKIELDQRGSGDGNYSFGESGPDYDGDGVPDDEEDGSSPRSTWSRTVSQIISMAIDDINDQLGKIDQELKLTDRQLAEIAANLERITRERAELAPQIEAQKQVVADQQVKVDAAQTAVTEQTAKVAKQTQIVEQKQTEVTAQEGVVAQKTVEEKQAADTLAAAKENTTVKAAEKVAADQKVEGVAQDYKDMAAGTLSYSNGKGSNIDVFKKTGPDGKEVLVDASGARLSEETLAAVRESNKNADGTVPSDTELTAKAKTFDESKVQSMRDDYRRFDNDAVYRDTAHRAAQKEEQKAQTAWESAADSLKTETQKLDTLKQELKDEQTKLDTEKQLLAEKQQKLEEEKKQLASDKEKLAALEEKDKALAKEQAALETQQKALTEKKQALLEQKEKLETAKEKLSDPAYQAKLKGMSPEQAAAELDKLPLSDGAKAQLAAEIKNTAPEASASPTAKGPTAIAATPSPTAEPLAAKSSQSNGSISFANQDGHGLQDNDKAQKAFTAAASQTVATEKEDELKVTTPAPTTQAPAPASAMV